MSTGLSQSDQKALLLTVREAISARLERRTPVWPDIGDAALERRGAFVTLHKKVAPDQRHLRGCIGRLHSEEPLDATIRTMAISAAFEDPRFPALISEELENIDVEISVLSPFTACTIDDIKPGLHGVYLTKGYRSAVFLPQVATEQGWNRETLLEQLCSKAGLPPGAYKEEEAKLFLFTATVFGEDTD